MVVSNIKSYKILGSDQSLSDCRTAIVKWVESIFKGLSQVDLDQNDDYDYDDNSNDDELLQRIG